MYWPVGAPKVYALSKHATPWKQDAESPDEAQDVPKASDALKAEDGRELISSGVSGSNATADTAQNGASAGGGDSGSDILAAKVSRGGGIFATITRSTLTVWQTQPVVALASVTRSTQSLTAYGPNTGLLLRPDALIVAVQTSQDYLVTYSLVTDTSASVYATQLSETRRHTRKDSIDGYSSYRRASLAFANDSRGPGEGGGIKEVNIRFRMVIRIDGGISKALALDDELVVSTQRPAALQCIRWQSDSAKAQTSTELLSRAPWVVEKCNVVEMVHDRPMNLMCWITSDGRAYAVQRRGAGNVDMDHPASLFQGYCFREPGTEDAVATKAAINARFSLIAIGCSNRQIDIYVVKDYMGNIPLSHKLRLSVTASTAGHLTSLCYSPDGYCLFASFERGWAMWSVYGKPGANSFGTDRALSEVNGEDWLQGVHDAFWIGGGCELVMLGIADDRLWKLDIARNAATGCLSPANVSRGLLHTSSSVVLYKGDGVPDLTGLSSDMSLWQSIQVPASYLLHQWPIKSAVISMDGKYVAVAGRRGLAHYSTISGRWKVFEDPAAEHEFAVRGGMCWYQHFLIAAIEIGNRCQVRVYSREKTLDYSHVQHTEELSAPAIFTAVTGTDSLLVYTYDNTLLHFVVMTSNASIRLVQVGQIGFHGIIRAPPRVRAISWILPEDQLEHGDPSQDVATASVLFLVDGKLVLLQPSTNEYAELKYDMRVIAQNVEYYVLFRDQPSIWPLPGHDSNLPRLISGLALDNHLGHGLRDSLWYFDGRNFHVWSDVQDVLACAPADLGRELPPTVQIALDFYPISVMIGKGIINGLDADFVQRRDINFSLLRLGPRTQLFLPQLLRYHLREYNESAALHLSQSYQHLPYFAHALEILLHDILDGEVDRPPSPPETALLPTAISFLSSFPSYLDVIVNCTRKTELRSWRTLFSYLPPVLELFEQSLAQNKLKTAAGYLLVLHTFEQDDFQIYEFARLLRRAAGEQDWELCKELARFLVGIDSSGQTLRAALLEAGLGPAREGSLDGILNGTSNGAQRPTHGQRQQSDNEVRVNGASASSWDTDYFSLQRSHVEHEEDSFATPGT